MKRKIITFTILLLLCMDLFAFIDTLAPMKAMSGIPMDPKQEWVNGKPKSGHYTPITKGGTWVDNENSDCNLEAGQYTDNEMIALGEIWQLDKSNYYDSSFVVKASCPNGFYFVSQSNPNYKRPFQLYLIPCVISEYVESTEWFHGGENVRKADTYGSIEIFSETNNRFELSYREILGNKEISFPGSGDFYDLSQAPRIWFDLVLVLPGEVKNDVLVWKDHGEFPLVEADDYSAVVTLDFQATVGGVLQPVKTLSIPFSGFYNKAVSTRDINASVSMYVHPTAAAGNINLKNYSRQQIADIEVMTTKPADSVRKYGFGVFISSSPDPFKPGEQFKFVKENLKYDDYTSHLNSYNSVPFDVILIDNKNPVNEKVYHGTDSVPNEEVDGKGTRHFGIPPYYTYEKIEALPVMLPTAEKVVSNTHSKGVDSWYFSGSAFVEIKGDPQITMEAGRYTSTVYIHVIGFN